MSLNPPTGNPWVDVGVAVLMNAGKLFGGTRDTDLNKRQRARFEAAGGNVIGHSEGAPRGSPRYEWEGQRIGKQEAKRILRQLDRRGPGGPGPSVADQLPPQVSAAAFPSWMPGLLIGAQLRALDYRTRGPKRRGKRKRKPKLPRGLGRFGGALGAWWALSELFANREAVYAEVKRTVGRLQVPRVGRYPWLEPWRAPPKGPPRRPAVYGTGRRRWGSGPPTRPTVWLPPVGYDWPDPPPPPPPWPGGVSTRTRHVVTIPGAIDWNNPRATAPYTDPRATAAEAQAEAARRAGPIVPAIPPVPRRLPSLSSPLARIALGAGLAALTFRKPAKRGRAGNPFGPGPAPTPTPTPLTSFQSWGLGFGSGTSSCSCPPKRKRKKGCTNPVSSRRTFTRGSKRFRTVTREIKCRA